MAIYMYTNSGHTDMIIIPTQTQPPFNIPDNEWYNNIIPNRIVDGDNTYYISDYGAYSQDAWFQNLDTSMIISRLVVDLYTNANYQIHCECTYNSSTVSWVQTFKTTKPDSSVWRNGGNDTLGWSSTDIKKPLFLCVDTYLKHNSDTIPVYGFILGYVKLQGLTPIFTALRTIFISKNLLSANAIDPTGGIPQQPEGGNGTFSAPSDTITPMTASELSTAMGGGGITAAGHGIHAYELTTANVSEFLQKIYGQGTDTFSDLWQQFQNYQYDPMSGIIGALILPCTATGTGVPAVTLSGQGIIITGGVKAITDRFANTNLCIIDCSNKVYDSFMDFEPYTKGTLYLPFIGNVSVNVNEFMYGYIEIYYTIDICTGNCVAFVTMRDKNNVHTQYTYSGNCGTPVPISGNDRGIAALINGTAGIFGGAVSLGAGIGLGNAGLAAKGTMSIIGGIGQIGMRPEHEKHTGGFGGGTGCMGYLTPFLMLNRPVVSTPENYTDLVGRMANQSQTVGAYSGYTEFDFVDLSGVDKLTESEIEEVQKILESGIYL